LARPEFDRGAAPPDLQLDHVLLVLTRSTEQQAALDRLLQEQQDKTSPSYRHWLTPQQFGERFGASPDDIAQITGWLESHGFTVDEVPASRGAVEFSGTAGQVQEAFHTAIHRYDVKGQEHWGNAREPEIPQALGGVVSGIANLDSFLPNRSSPGLRRLFRFRRAPAPSLFIVLGGTITLLAPKT
jgi:subtilase family serine protease